MRFSKLSIIPSIALLAFISSSITTGILPGRSIQVLAQTQVDRKAEADRLYQQGEQQYETSQFQDALQSYQQALSLYREIGDRGSEGVLLNNIGLVYGSLGQYFQALEQLQQALKISREIGDREGELILLNRIGSLYRSIGQYSQALEFHQQALTICKESGNQIWEGITLNNIGVDYDTLRQYPRALEYFQQALKIYREIGNQGEEGTTLNNIGLAHYDLEQYPQALEFFQQALKIAKAINNRSKEGAALNYIGLVYERLGQYSQALEFFQQSLTIRREIGDRAGEGTAFGDIGLVYSSLGQYLQALEFLQQGLEIARELGNRSKEGDLLNYIGLVYESLGQYSQALEFFQQSLAIRREISDRVGEGAALNNIGLVYSSLGQYPQALEFLQQGLEIAKEGSYRAGEETALANIGYIYYKLGQYPLAENFLRQGLEIAKELGDPSSEGATLNRIGLVYANSGQYLRALDYHQQALKIFKTIGDRAGEGVVLGNIGLAHRNLAQYPQALEFLQQALEILKAVGDRGSEGAMLNNMGAVLLETGQLAAATKTLFSAIEVQDSLRTPELSDANKVSLFNTQITPYNFLQQALIAQNQLETALEVSERGRARAFVELLSRRVLPEAIGQIETVSASTIEQIKQIAHEQNATLVQYSIVRAPFQVDGKEEWRQSNLYIWVVKPTGEVDFRSVDLSTAKPTLNELVNLSRQNMGVRGRGAPPQLPPRVGQQPGQDNLRLHQLHQILIEPIADLLPTNPDEHVIFIPQGELFLVPFPALVDANGQYLIEHHTILTAPSIQVLGLTQQLAKQKSMTQTVTDASQMLVVGNPTIPSQLSLSSLPGAEQEAIAIAQQFQTQPLLGDAATEPAVVQRMASASIIHLATHGLLEYGDPAASGVRDMPGAIVLARAGQSDGLLTSSEISTLDLAADLVVLSACDTGQGDITGDGVIGLSRALISTGVPSVIVSLWNVQDDSTEMLMSEFYRQLQQQPDKAQALRQAMLKTRQEYPNPHDWAAFTLIGEAE